MVDGCIGFELRRAFEALIFHEREVGTGVEYLVVVFIRGLDVSAFERAAHDARLQRVERRTSAPIVLCLKSEGLRIEHGMDADTLVLEALRLGQDGGCPADRARRGNESADDALHTRRPDRLQTGMDK